MIAFCILGVGLFYTVFFYTVMKYQRINEFTATA
jgi:hypothetical protein